ncbi:alpha/beta fold hydrolase [Carboxylicivirga caseinilyticus]|uniref:alpha/beta fold hydrolase n=1 Tax=Carboxylicivirga caseinilyticus TaxID=3417572 RepID=UPI003D330700|nr:alpha/beta fold hydrolase [Marinilabiliaceae bacterium A049]
MAAFEQTYTFDIAHQSIAYHRFGKGEPVLFIHGITTYSFIWRNIVPFFAENYDVIAVDLAGCGESSKNIDDSYSLKNHAGMLLKLIDHLDLHNVHLVCHDV